MTIPVVHVRPGGDDGSDGLSWSTAKATVGAGVDRAYVLGGEVWVAEGTYVEHLFLPAWVHAYGGFAGDETERDSRDPSAHPSVLDGGGVATVVFSALAGHRVSALDGFTVQHGGEPTLGSPLDPGGPGGRGGGIDCNVSSPILENNVVRDNSLGGPYTTENATGGGIGLYGSYALIRGNVIRDNEALHWTSQGGGIYATLSMPVIEDNEIRTNHAPYGAAIFAWNSWPAIVGNTIADNVHYLYAPVYFGSVTGAVDLMSCPGFRIARNTIRGTVAATGAGITAQVCDGGRIESNLIVNNIARNESGMGGIGGGVYVQLLQSPAGRTVIANNTFSGNTATNLYAGEQGGALAVVMMSDSMDVADNVMAFNSSGIWRHPGSTLYSPVLATNDLFNGAYDYVNLPAGPTDLHLDPLFADRPSGDYHLPLASPCTDAGSNEFTVDGALDRDGAPRVQDSDASGGAVVDIGAYEFSPDFDGDGSPDWQDADDDDDGIDDEDDCAPLDPWASVPPAAVQGLLVEGRFPTIVSWQGQGTGFRYDVAGGGIEDLRSDGGVAGAACLADDLEEASWEDSGSDPGAGEALYYLARAQNACGDGTWGHASSGQERLPTGACP